MFPNPKNTDELIGFEVDIVEALAEQMGENPFMSTTPGKI